MKSSYDFEPEETRRFKIGDNWEDAGRVGEYFGYIRVNGVKWAIILFDGEEDPDLHKAAGLLVKQSEWRTI